MKKIFALFLIYQFLSVSSSAQSKINFDSLYSKIIKPPSNCEDASKLFPLDSASGKVISGIEFSELEAELNKIQSEIDSSVNKFKKQKQKMPGPPSGFGPPGGMPPVDFNDMSEINEKQAKAFENITISINRFKDEILVNQEDLNKNLKKTRLPEKNERLKYVNEFLAITRAEYEKCLNIVLKNVTDLEQTFKDNKPSANRKIPNISNLKYESEQIDTIMFFYKISKQLTEAGSMFFYGIK